MASPAPHYFSRRARPSGMALRHRIENLLKEGEFNTRNPPKARYYYWIEPWFVKG